MKSPRLVVLGLMCMGMGVWVLHVTSEPSRIYAKIEQQFWHRAHAGARLEDDASRALDREFDAAVARADMWLIIGGIFVAFCLVMLVRELIARRDQRSARLDRWPRGPGRSAT